MEDFVSAPWLRRLITATLLAGLDGEARVMEGLEQESGGGDPEGRLVHQREGDGDDRGPEPEGPSSDRGPGDDRRELEPPGLPVGVQVIGPFLSDMRLLRIAELLDSAAGPGFTAPPVGLRS